MTEYKIQRLGHQGDGIAEGPVYAPLTLPGEVVSGQLQGSSLADIRIETPSSDRMKPPCRHFKTCGGCQLQHASDCFLSNWKQEIVLAALAAHGMQADFLPIVTSPARSRRRATFSARRTKKGAMAGFHIRRSDLVTEIPDCQLLHPDLMQGVDIAAAIAGATASRKHGLRVSVTLTRNGLDVIVLDGKELDGPLRIVLADLAARHDLARLTWQDETVVTRNPPVQDFSGIEVVPPPGAFLQATQAGEQALRQDVLDFVGPAERVADLFAGCGTFALPLARTCEAHAVEGDAEMTAALDTAWRDTSGLKRVTSETRDLFRHPLLVDELSNYDAVVIDPPRAGAQAQIAQLAAAAVPVIAYVSCNPVSFARDAKTLIDAGYELSQMRIVDQFRWSAHIELVAAFQFKSS